MRLNIRLDLTSEQMRLRLLEGLDSWVKLGLLSDEQVRELARSLSEPLPTAQENPAASWPPYVSGGEVTNEATAGELPNEFARELPSEFASQPEAVSAEAPRSKISQALQTLLEEISVIWLLFLGVFLVVVSSGVLAASQWESFSSVGQYAILLAYTLVFWGASLWAQQQEKLQATGKMLALTTALLIPINFWMMDAVGVFRSPLGMAAGGLSALLLSALLIKLLAQRSNQLNLIGLSWLHLGWAGAGIAGGWAFWPVVATYLGTVGTAASLIYQERQASPMGETSTQALTAEQPQTVASESSEPASELSSELSSEPASKAVSETERETDSAESSLLFFDVLTVALSMLLLLFRSLVMVQVPPHQLGLAAGICGWLFVWLNRNRANRGLWQWTGFGLLLVGWAISVNHQPPLQALGVSGLALWLIADRFKLSWKTEHLLALIAVAGQAYWLLGAILPLGTRDAVIKTGQQLSSQAISTGEWVSLGYFPFLLGLLWFARRLRQWQQPALAKTTARAALGLGAGLTVLSLSNPFTLAVNLLLSAIALLVIAQRRPAIGEWLVTLAHVVFISAVAAWIYYLWPNLTAIDWAYIWLTGGITEFALHLGLRSPGGSPDDANPGNRGQQWRRSTYGAGLCLFALSYLCLIWAALSDTWRPEPDWLWLIVPVVLTGVANHRRALFPVSLAQLTPVALVLQTPWLISRSQYSAPGVEVVSWQMDWPLAIASFAIGTLCMLINSRIWRSQWAALFTVGSGIACATSILWYSLINQASLSKDYIPVFWVLEIGCLWLLARVLVRRTGDLAALYQRAASVWGFVLMLGWLLAGTLWASLWAVIGLGMDSNSGDRYFLLATILLMAMLLEAIRYRPTEWRYWSLAWAGAIALTLGVAQQGLSLGSLAIAFLALGLITQIAGDIWTLKRPPYRRSWHGIPLVYAAFGTLLGHSTAFLADSGLYTLAAGAILLGVGRRKVGLKALSYLGLAALSVGVYELLIYRMLQASGGQPGDGFTLMAVLAGAIALTQRVLSPWLTRYLKLPLLELRAVSQAHWALGTALILIAALEGLSQPTGISLWTVTVLGLAAYALITGNQRWTPQMLPATNSIWTGIGILQGLFCLAHNRFVWFPDRTFLITWGGVMACAVSWLIFQAPWQRWGWPQRPWRLLALWLPLSIIGAAINYQVPTQSLLLVGAFYAWMAKQREQIRISYLSVLLFDWALLRYLSDQGWLTALVWSLVISVSALYVAEIEPYFQGLSKRQQRHWLRSLASALIGITSLYQTEIYQPLLLYAALTLALSMGLILSGLMMKVRAFLYVGTVTFIVQIIRVLWLLISDNSLLLWAVGIALGLVFIWVAATFESRRGRRQRPDELADPRSQSTPNRFETWSAALRTWD